MGPMDIVFLVFLIVAALGTGLYFLNKWAMKKMDQQQSLISKTRTVVNIFVIDKKRDKVTNVNLPKAAMEQMPKTAKLMKMYFVQAKIGAQIMTLMCDKKVFEVLPVRKSVKVGLAGIYIVDMPGMKSEKQMKEERKAKEAAKKGDVPEKKNPLSFIKNIKK
ncbi:MAG: hypothetical protein LBS21_02880 [Clostridiales bacterium]|jgi:hypothetical protein|nr:hypothetical protein [Clostridiales bacterium]